MSGPLEVVDQSQKKQKTPDVRSGDTVRVHQTVEEGGRARTQMFEGVVIRTGKMKTVQANMTVRRTAGRYGVEKDFKLHAPNLTKVEVIRRGKVGRKNLNYLRKRSGRSARMKDEAYIEQSEDEATGVVLDEEE